MLQDLWLECKRNMDTLLEQGILQNGFVVAFGSNEPAERMADYLAERGVYIKYFVDNNKKQWGRNYGSIPVCSPDEVLGEFVPNAVILIASRYFNEMSLQLRKMGYLQGKHIFKMVDYIPFANFCVDDCVFDNMLLRVNKGVEKLEEIKNIYGNEKHIFLCVYRGLGDVYVASKLMKPYMKKNHIKEYVVVVTGGACGKVAKIFDYENVFSVTDDEARCMMQAITFLGYKECNATIMHHVLPYTNQVKQLACIKDVNFFDEYRIGTCGLVNDEELCEPVVTKENIEGARAWLTKAGLEENKTVILAPYSNTVTKVDKQIWIDLIEKYTNLGYTICTNCGGSEEHALPGTAEVRVSLTEMIPFCELCGTFIGLRSGICDVISSAKCKKIIYYPDRIYKHGFTKDFYSLKQMGLAEDVEEYTI